MKQYVLLNGALLEGEVVYTNKKKGTVPYIITQYRDYRTGNVIQKISLIKNKILK